MSNERKIPDTISKTFVKILDDIMPAFREKDPNIFLAELLFFGVLDKDEGSLVDAVALHTRKFVEMFSLMKPKPDDIVFPVLQKICIKLKWRSVLHLIQSNLRLEQMENFIVPDYELQKDHKIFKHAIPTMQLLFVGRNAYLTKIHDLIEHYNQTEECNMSKLIKIAVTGLGGVGKTQLVIHFVAKYQLDYDSIIWINAESYNTSVNSFTNLGRRLGTFNSMMDMRTNVEAIYDMLSRNYSRNLLIFDNADDYIPREFWFDNLDNFVLLITSRNRQWPFFTTKVDVGVFQHNEAVEFVKKSISEENYDFEGDIDNLVKELQFFPLALQQAVAYIKQSHEEEKMSSSRFTINDYLREYATERKALLNFSIPVENNQVNFITTLNTWSVTVTKLSGMVYTGKYNKEDFPVTLHLKILNLICFLDGEQIDPMYFLETAKQNKKHLGWSIIKLDQYSMVNKVAVGEQEKRMLINVHKLVQEITRIRLQDEHLESPNFVIISYIMISQAPVLEQSFKDWATYTELLPHFSSLKKALDLVLHTGESYAAVKESLRMSFLSTLQICYLHSGNYMLRKNCLLECMLVEQRLNGYGSIYFMSLLNCLACVIESLNHPKTAKVLLKRALECENNPVTKVFRSAQLSGIDRDLGKYKKQEEFFEKWISDQSPFEEFGENKDETNIVVDESDLLALQTKKLQLENGFLLMNQFCVDDNPTVVVTYMAGLATIYRDLGNHKEQLILLEKAEKILENYSGPENIAIAAALQVLANETGDPNKRIMLAERALKIYENNVGLEHIALSPALRILAIAYKKLGDTQREKSLWERELNIYEKHYGLQHVRVCTYAHGLGWYFIRLGDLTKGKALLEKALHIAENFLPSNHKHIANILLRLSYVYRQLSDFESEKTLLERALEIQKRNNSSDNDKLTHTLNSLSEVNLKLGNVVMAIPYMEQGLTNITKITGNNDLLTAVSQLFPQADSDKVNDINPEALRNMVTALKQLRPASNPLILECLKLLADLYAKRGDFAKEAEVLSEYHLLQNPTNK